MSRVLAFTRAAVGAWPDLLGLAGLVATVYGVHEVFGRGWALIAFGLPVFLGYVVREVRAGRPRRRG